MTTFNDIRSPRQQLQDEFIARIVDGMDIKDLVQYAYDSLTDFYDEMTDEELNEAVKEIYPDYFEENQ
jgi:predicted metallo-beta-lactamase superfamily hydrolase